MLIQPKIKSDVLNPFYSALLEEKKLQVKYCPRGQTSVKEYVLNPLTLIYRKRIIYLLATAYKYEDVRQFALHRFQKGEMLDEARLMPEGFCVDQYIDEGNFNYSKNASSIQLEALFDEAVSAHLEETPLSSDQVTKREDGYVHLTASVQDSSQLRWWLLGFGDHVKVIAPQSLKSKIVEIVQNMASSYELI